MSTEEAPTHPQIIAINIPIISNFIVKFKLIPSDGKLPNGKMPTKGSDGAAGYDVYSAEDVIIPRVTIELVKKKILKTTLLGKDEKDEKFNLEESLIEALKEPFEEIEQENVVISQRLVKTDIATKFSSSHYIRIAPRSGLTWKNHIYVGAGVIDSDYRGNIGIILENHGTEDYHIKKGDRIAQFIFEKCESNVKFEETTDLEATDRGAGGYGSTGIF